MPTGGGGARSFSSPRASACSRGGVGWRVGGRCVSIVFVVEKGHLIHPATVLARNEILLNQMKARQAEAKKED